MKYEIDTLEKLENLTELAFEFVAGEIYPKEGDLPLTKLQIETLLFQKFDYQWLKQNIPMVSIKHTKLISRLQRFIYAQISPTYECYGEGMQVKVSRNYFSFRKPDITISLIQTEEFEKSSLVNPLSIIEVLSPSTQHKDLNEKKEEYFQIPSLEEYILISQEEYKIQQFLRSGKTKWTMRVYDAQNQTCMMTVGVKIEMDKLYQGIL